MNCPRREAECHRSWGRTTPVTGFHRYRAVIVVGILQVQFKGTYRRALDGIAIGISLGRVGFIFVNSLLPLCLPSASGIGPPIVGAWAPVDDYVDY